jgi:hypothetical protein
VIGQKAYQPVESVLKFQIYPFNPIRGEGGLWVSTRRPPIIVRHPALGGDEPVGNFVMAVELR